MEILEQMFEHAHSTACGQMSARGLLLFQHNGRLGNSPAHALFDQVSVEHVDPTEPAGTFNDYRVLFDGQPNGEAVKLGGEKDLGNGATLIRRF